MRKHWDVTLVPDGGCVRSFKIPFALVIGLLLFLTSGIATVAGSGLIALKSLKSRQDTRRVRTENVTLKGHLSETERKIDQLEGMVLENERLERRARELAGLDSIDAQTRRMGVGGPFLAAAEITQLADLGLDRSIKSQSRRLDELIRRTRLQRESYEQTLEALDDKAELIAHTPTIPPLKNGYEVSSGFGARSDPFTGERGVHNGLDLRAPNGTPVYATADGTVEHAGPDGDFGKCVRIDHGNGIVTVYCHLSSIDVSAGQVIRRGTHIGGVGSTGRSTGSHLHYEVHVDGVPRDPAQYILSPASVID